MTRQIGPAGPNHSSILANVASRWNGVDIWVNIEWSADISLYADYLIINP